MGVGFVCPALYQPRSPAPIPAGKYIENHGVIHNMWFNTTSGKKVPYYGTQGISAWWDNGSLPIWITAQRQVSEWLQPPPLAAPFWGPKPGPRTNGQCGRGSGGHGAWAPLANPLPLLGSPRHRPRGAARPLLAAGVGSREDESCKGLALHRPSPRTAGGHPQENTPTQGLKPPWAP